MQIIGQLYIDKQSEEEKEPEDLSISLSSSAIFDDSTLQRPMESP